MDELIIKDWKKLYAEPAEELGEAIYSKLELKINNLQIVIEPFKDHAIATLRELKLINAAQSQVSKKWVDKITGYHKEVKIIDG